MISINCGLDSISLIAQTILSKGESTYIAKSSYQDGIWSDFPISLEFINLPSWYLTFWAKLIYIIFFALAIVWIYKYLIWRWRVKFLVKLKVTEKYKIFTFSLQIPIDQYKFRPEDIIEEIQEQNIPSKINKNQNSESDSPIKERYSAQSLILSQENAFTSTDEKFLDKIQKIVDEDLSDNNFTVKQFCRKLGMSRMQLHRKLTALTGLSTTAFMRDQRLRMALKQLEKSDESISEVGYTVGFNSPSYFIKCFKETYHMTPSEYLGNVKK